MVRPEAPKDAFGSNLLSCIVAVFATTTGETIIHSYIFKTYPLDVFLPIVHAKTPENADENEDFRKRFQNWRVLKTHLQ